MLQIRLLFTVAMLAITLSVFSQNARISGFVFDSTSRQHLINVVVFLENTDYSTVSNIDGYFLLDNVPVGKYVLIAQTDLYNDIVVNINVIPGENVLDTLKLRQREGGTDMLSAEDLIPTVSLSDNDLRGDGAQNVSGLLTSSRDVFISTSAFMFGTYRFRIRGYDSENTDVFLDNLPMEDLEDGRTYWNQWGGLNDVFRSRENVVGLDPVNFTFGCFGGASGVNTNAANQRKQVRISYSASNRSYNNRLMATYSTGLMPKGWAVSLSASRRWAKEGYVEGTSYDAWSYFAALEKVFKNQSINLTVFGAPTKRGKTSPTYQEAYNLAGTNYYNPNWGYQDGVKRNSDIVHSHLPTFILSHEWKISDKTSLSTSLGYQFGQNGSTTINWYNAPDPRPDYYRNLPSYITDSSLQARARQNYEENPDLLQLNWDRFYSVNSMSSETVKNFNGTGRDTTINLSRYVIEDRRFDKKRFSASMVFEHKFSEKYIIQGGANYVWQRTYNYKVLNDLLGGDLFLDRNQFAERSFIDSLDAVQNDLDNPNRLIKVGDRYGYDYNITASKPTVWAQGIINLRSWEFFAAANISHTTYYRTGNYRSGLFPNDSKGNSDNLKFFNYGVKGGITYKINGRNYLVANGGYMTRAPYSRNAFIQPRTRNQVVSNLQNEQIITFEGGYLLRAPKFKARAIFYYTQFLNGTDTYSFYYDLERNFVNIALTNIDKRHLGGEFAIEAQLGKGFSITAVSALGQHIYTSRQLATITLDNSAEVLAKDVTVYSKNMFVANGPQFANNLGLSYRSPKFWFASIYLNYFDRIYVDFNRLRRTDEAVDLVDPSSDLWSKILQQQELKGQFTLDLFGGTSFRLNKWITKLERTTDLIINVGVNNILNNKKFITGGYEQTRLDYSGNNVERFPPNYFYAFGTNFFVNVTLKF
ncbi:carboxypeptidase-like regulatory domain-containing protein [soil metagenome]